MYMLLCTPFLGDSEKKKLDWKIALMQNTDVPLRLRRIIENAPAWSSDTDISVVLCKSGSLGVKIL
jgi:hypothetical protein